METALALVGTPYRAGGQSPDRGFDCSGFVAWVFAQHGLALPRTVNAQLAAGQPLDDTSVPSVADLVFFEIDQAGPTHVGIALGNQRFIHAPSARGVVRVERLDSPYWASRFRGARRVAAETPR
jgi:cell wall-associated NlpC family hydrolase